MKPEISYFQIDYRRKLILSIKFDKKMWCFPRNIEARYSFYSGSRTGRNLFFPDFSSRKYIIIKYFRQKNKNFSDFEKTGKYILFEISKRGTFRLGRTFEKKYFSMKEKTWKGNLSTLYRTSGNIIFHAVTVPLRKKLGSST